MCLLSAYENTVIPFSHAGCISEAGPFETARDEGEFIRGFARLTVRA